MKLVIVESPAKCQKIQGFLGPGFKVIASMGHIRALEEDLDAVGLERDFEAKFHFMKEKARAIATLKDAYAQANEQVFLAADDDREGEAIAYSVALLLKLSTSTTPRAVFHEITEKAVKAAIQNPRKIDLNKVNAQQARSILDMMVGFTISPLLWKHIGPGLSAGRCQTPALRLVVEKEREIRDFKSANSWRISGNWTNGTIKINANMTEDLEDEESALNYLDNIHEDVEGHITEAITRPWSAEAPKPLITSTLQQEASALYRTNPKATMQIAQRLYESGHITYMRTDKAVLSEEAVTAAMDWVRANLGEEYVADAQVEAEPSKKTKKNKSEKEVEKPKAQEAHEAIRPTHFEVQELPANEDWSAVDRKIYKLIWNRAVQSIMTSARGETRKITLRADGDTCEFDWQAQFKRTTFQGWKKLGATAVLDEAESTEEGAQEEDHWKNVRALEKGGKLKWEAIEANPYETKPTTRYTEATLVRDLEKKGIGRPSTFAMLLSAIQEKGYAKKEDKPAQKVQKTKYMITGPLSWPPVKTLFERPVGAEKDKLVPTPLGERVMEFCLEKFSDLFNYGFTAQLESRLDKVAEGNEVWKQVLRDTWDSYKERYQSLKSAPSTSIGGGGNSKMFQGENGIQIKAVQGKKGPILLVEDPQGDKEKTQFYGWPEGKVYDSLTQDDVDEFLEARKTTLESSTLGTLDGKPMLKKTGPFGPYVQWGDVRMSIKGQETAEEIQNGLREKAKASASLHVLGPFEFRRGPYGIYMFKKDIKDRKFVGVPDSCNFKNLTQEEAVKLYQAGIQNKAKGHTYSTTGTGTGTGGGRGGFRGRGRGRGRGH